jgi:hypothetical protein
VQVTENGTESDAVRTGPRTSTLISFSIVPPAGPSGYAVTVSRTRSVLPPPAGKDSVFHPGSGTEPCASTHRYSTLAGSRPTVNAAVNAGA